MKIVSCLLLVLALGGSVQAQGVHFEDGLSWADIQAKAKAENKYIFVDGFTTWCGPCRFMRDNILTQPEAGAFFNDKFISVSVQLDTTARDDRAVRSWYRDAHALMTQYNIRAFPTFLVFSPEGRPLQRIVGSRNTALLFISAVEESFDSTKQYYTKLQQYRDGRRDKDFLRKLALQAVQVYDLDNGREVANAYLAGQTNLFNRGALEVLAKYTESSGDARFSLFVEHAAEIDSVLGAGAAEQHVNETLVRDYVEPAFGGGYEPNWKSIKRQIAGRFPAQAEEATARGKIMYFQMKRMWSSFREAVAAYMQQYGAHASPEEINGFSLAIFKNCSDKKCLTQALEWSKRTFADKDNPYFMETYASLLYRLGNKDDAIAWEQKALDAAGPRTKAHYQETIGKMQRGEKTWD
ncbi:MAG TPA: thioredoxin family protein [Puia sp.]|nr:thioredoxin family protein [Puia sp.]